jgi:3-phosphoshikimate 1-carboxyvinyltransferase
VRVARFEPSGALRGSLRAPPDKSISHRAALIAAMAEGESGVERYLDAADARSTLRALVGLGVAVDEAPAGPGAIDLRVRGVGLRGARSGDGSRRIDVGNAGTLLRLLPGWLAGQERGSWTLDGDESIRRRPVDRVAEPLRLMGARVECRDRSLPPLTVEAGKLAGITYELPVASAQVKSCVLLAGLLADGTTTVVEPTTTRDHTERLMASAGAPIETEAGGPVSRGGRVPPRRISVHAAERIEPGELGVPGDISSAAFPLVAGLIVPGSEVLVEGVGLNPTRVGLLGIANRMGAAIEVEEGTWSGHEPRGSVLARHSTLQGTRVGAAEVPLAIDELPLVALLGCFADGETVVTGAEELRHKESDRIAAAVEGLRALGAEIEALSDGFAVRGAGELQGGTLDARGDHRMAMLGAIAGPASRDGVEVRGIDAAAISYPEFEADIRRLLSR